MSFTVSRPDAPPERVLTGPAWGSDHTAEVFELMHLEVDLGAGTMPLEQLAAGIAMAKRVLPEVLPLPRRRLVRTVDSLATWATVARLKGATDIAWREDF